MRVLEDTVSLVIAGAWNPAILTPNWIAEKAMHREVGTNFPVQVQLPIGGFNFGVVRPRLGFAGISVSAEPQTLTFQLPFNNDEEANISVTTAANILDLLPHTPVTGFGFNFGFQFDQPSPRLLQTFTGLDFLTDTIHDENASLVSRSWNGTVNTDHALITISAKYEANQVMIGANVHTEVSSAEFAAKALRKENLFYDVKSQIINLVNQLEEAQGAIQ